MRYKINCFKRTRNGVWSKRGEWLPLYVFEQQHQAGIEYQHYMYGPDGKPLCAGVTRHERMNKAIANQIVHVWNRWRQEYVQRNPGNYPTAQQAAIPVAKICVFPVGNSSVTPVNSTVEWFEFS